MMASPQRAPGTPRPAGVPSVSSRLRPQRVVMKRQGTSYVASKARAKLEDAAAAPEWDLRQLIGHANTLDHLAERLADPNRKKRHEAEQQQAEIDAIAAKTEAASDPHLPAPHTEPADDAKGEEEEEKFNEDSSDTYEDVDSDNESEWLSTEPSTALEHDDSGDYFGSLVLERTTSNKDYSPSSDVVEITLPDDKANAESLPHAEFAQLKVH